MEKNSNLKEKIISKLREYRYVLLVLALGLLLLMLPHGSDGDQPEVEPEAGTAARDTQEEPLERRLEEILSLVDGAGQVRVLLTFEDDGERVLAGDSQCSQETDAQGERMESSDTTVTVSKGGGVSGTVEVSYRYPGFRGAVVAAQGADSAQVRLELAQAVKAVTGLGYENIKIVKMADK